MELDKASKENLPVAHDLSTLWADATVLYEATTLLQHWLPHRSSASVSACCKNAPPTTALRHSNSVPRASVGPLGANPSSGVPRVYQDAPKKDIEARLATSEVSHHPCASSDDARSFQQDVSLQSPKSKEQKEEKKEKPRFGTVFLSPALHLDEQKEAEEGSAAFSSSSFVFEHAACQWVAHSFLMTAKERLSCLCELILPLLLGVARECRSSDAPQEEYSKEENRREITVEENKQEWRSLLPPLTPSVQTLLFELQRVWTAQLAPLLDAFWSPMESSLLETANPSPEAVSVPPLQEREEVHPTLVDTTQHFRNLVERLCVQWFSALVDTTEEEEKRDGQQTNLPILQEERDPGSTSAAAWKKADQEGNVSTTSMWIALSHVLRLPLEKLERLRTPFLHLVETKTAMQHEKDEEDTRNESRVPSRLELSLLEAHFQSIASVRLPVEGTVVPHDGSLPLPEWNAQGHHAGMEHEKSTTPPLTNTTTRTQEEGMAAVEEEEEGTPLLSWNTSARHVVQRPTSAGSGAPRVKREGIPHTKRTKKSRRRWHRKKHLRLLLLASSSSSSSSSCSSFRSQHHEGSSYESIRGVKQKRPTSSLRRPHRFISSMAEGEGEKSRGYRPPVLRRLRISLPPPSPPLIAASTREVPTPLPLNPTTVPHVPEKQPSSPALPTAVALTFLLSSPPDWSLPAWTRIGQSASAFTAFPPSPIPVRSLFPLLLASPLPVGTTMGPTSLLLSSGTSPLPSSSMIPNGGGASPLSPFLRSFRNVLPSNAVPGEDMEKGRAGQKNPRERSRSSANREGKEEAPAPPTPVLHYLMEEKMEDDVEEEEEEGGVFSVPSPFARTARPASVEPLSPLFRASPSSSRAAAHAFLSFPFLLTIHSCFPSSCKEEVSSSTEVPDALVEEVDMVEDSEEGEEEEGEESSPHPWEWVFPVPWHHPSSPIDPSWHGYGSFPISTTPSTSFFSGVLHPSPSTCFSSVVSFVDDEEDDDRPCELEISKAVKGEHKEEEYRGKASSERAGRRLRVQEHTAGCRGVEEGGPLSFYPPAPEAGSSLHHALPASSSSSGLPGLPTSASSSSMSFSSSSSSVGWVPSSTSSPTKAKSLPLAFSLTSRASAVGAARQSPPHPRRVASVEGGRTLGARPRSGALPSGIVERSFSRSFRPPVSSLNSSADENLVGKEHDHAVSSPEKERVIVEGDAEREKVVLSGTSSRLLPPPGRLSLPSLRSSTSSPPLPPVASRCSPPHLLPTPSRRLQAGTGGSIYGVGKGKEDEEEEGVERGRSITEVPPTSVLAPLSLTALQSRDTPSTKGGGMKKEQAMEPPHRRETMGSIREATAVFTPSPFSISWIDEHPIKETPSHFPILRIRRRKDLQKETDVEGPTPDENDPERTRKTGHANNTPAEEAMETEPKPSLENDEEKDHVLQTVPSSSPPSLLRSKERHSSTALPCFTSLSAPSFAALSFFPSPSLPPSSRWPIASGGGRDPTGSQLEKPRQSWKVTPMPPQSYLTQPSVCGLTSEDIPPAESSMVQRSTGSDGSPLVQEEEEGHLGVRKKKPLWRPRAEEKKDLPFFPLREGGNARSTDGHPLREDGGARMPSEALGIMVEDITTLGGLPRPASFPSPPSTVPTTRFPLEAAKKTSSSEIGNELRAFSTPLPLFSSSLTSFPAPASPSPSRPLSCPSSQPSLPPLPPAVVVLPPGEPHGGKTPKDEQDDEAHEEEKEESKEGRNIEDKLATADGGGGGRERGRKPVEEAGGGTSSSSTSVSSATLLPFPPPPPISSLPTMTTSSSFSLSSSSVLGPPAPTMGSALPPLPPLPAPPCATEWLIGILDGSSSVASLRFFVPLASWTTPALSYRTSTTTCIPPPSSSFSSSFPFLFPTGHTSSSPYTPGWTPIGGSSVVEARATAGFPCVMKDATLPLRSPSSGKGGHFPPSLRSTAAGFPLLLESRSDGSSSSLPLHGRQWFEKIQHELEAWTPRPMEEPQRRKRLPKKNAKEQMEERSDEGIPKSLGHPSGPSTGELVEWLHTTAGCMEVYLSSPSSFSPPLSCKTHATPVLPDAEEKEQKGSMRPEHSPKRRTHDGGSLRGSPPRGETGTPREPLPQDGAAPAWSSLVSYMQARSAGASQPAPVLLLDTRTGTLYAVESWVMPSPPPPLPPTTATASLETMRKEVVKEEHILALSFRLLLFCPSFPSSFLYDRRVSSQVGEEEWWKAGTASFPRASVEDSKGRPVLQRSSPNIRRGSPSEHAAVPVRIPQAEEEAKRTVVPLSSALPSVLEVEKKEEQQGWEGGVTPMEKQGSSSDPTPTTTKVIPFPTSFAFLTVPSLQQTSHVQALGKKEPLSGGESAAHENGSQKETEVVKVIPDGKRMRLPLSLPLSQPVDPKRSSAITASSTRKEEEPEKEEYHKGVGQEAWDGGKGGETEEMLRKGQASSMFAVVGSRSASTIAEDHAAERGSALPLEKKGKAPPGPRQLLGVSSSLFASSHAETSVGDRENDTSAVEERQQKEWEEKQQGEEESQNKTEGAEQTRFVVIGCPAKEDVIGEEEEEALVLRMWIDEKKERSFVVSSSYGSSNSPRSSCSFCQGKAEKEMRDDNEMEKERTIPPPSRPFLFSSFSESLPASDRRASFLSVPQRLLSSSGKARDAGRSLYHDASSASGSIILEEDPAKEGRKQSIHSLISIPKQEQKILQEDDTEGPKTPAVEEASLQKSAGGKPAKEKEEEDGPRPASGMFSKRKALPKRIQGVRGKGDAGGVGSLCSTIPLPPPLPHPVSRPPLPTTSHSVWNTHLSSRFPIPVANAACRSPSPPPSPGLPFPSLSSPVVSSSTLFVLDRLGDINLVPLEVLHQRIAALQSVKWMWSAMQLHRKKTKRTTKKVRRGSMALSTSSSSSLEAYSSFFSHTSADSSMNGTEDASKKPSSSLSDENTEIPHVEGTTSPSTESAPLSQARPWYADTSTILLLHDALLESVLPPVMECCKRQGRREHLAAWSTTPPFPPPPPPLSSTSSLAEGGIPGSASEAPLTPRRFPGNPSGPFSAVKRRTREPPIASVEEEEEEMVVRGLSPCRVGMSRERPRYSPLGSPSAMTPLSFVETSNESPAEAQEKLTTITTSVITEVAEGMETTQRRSIRKPFGRDRCVSLSHRWIPQKPGEEVKMADEDHPVPYEVVAHARSKTEGELLREKNKWKEKKLPRYRSAHQPSTTTSPASSPVLSHFPAGREGTGKDTHREEEAVAAAEASTSLSPLASTPSSSPTSYTGDKEGVRGHPAPPSDAPPRPSAPPSPTAEEVVVLLNVCEMHLVIDLLPAYRFPEGRRDRARYCRMVRSFYNDMEDQYRPLFPMPVETFFVEGKGGTPTATPEAAATAATPSTPRPPRWVDHVLARSALYPSLAVPPSAASTTTTMMMMPAKSPTLSHLNSHRNSAIHSGSSHFTSSTMRTPTQRVTEALALLFPIVISSHAGRGGERGTGVGRGGGTRMSPSSPDPSAVSFSSASLSSSTAVVSSSGWRPPTPLIGNGIPTASPTPLPSSSSTAGTSVPRTSYAATRLQGTAPLNVSRMLPPPRHGASYPPPSSSSTSSVGSTTWRQPSGRGGQAISAASASSLSLHHPPSAWVRPAPMHCSPSLSTSSLLPEEQELMSCGMGSCVRPTSTSLLPEVWSVQQGITMAEKTITHPRWYLSDALLSVLQAARATTVVTSSGAATLIFPFITSQRLNTLKEMCLVNRPFSFTADKGIHVANQLVQLALEQQARLHQQAPFPSLIHIPLLPSGYKRIVDPAAYQKAASQSISFPQLEGMPDKQAPRSPLSFLSFGDEEVEEEEEAHHRVDEEKEGEGWVCEAAKVQPTATETPDAWNTVVVATTTEPAAFHAMVSPYQRVSLLPVDTTDALSLSSSSFLSQNEGPSEEAIPGKEEGLQGYSRKKGAEGVVEIVGGDTLGSGIPEDEKETKRKKRKHTNKAETGEGLAMDGIRGKEKDVEKSGLPDPMPPSEEGKKVARGVTEEEGMASSPLPFGSLFCWDEKVLSGGKGLSLPLVPFVESSTNPLEGDRQKRTGIRSDGEKEVEGEGTLAKGEKKRRNSAKEEIKEDIGVASLLSSFVQTANENTNGTARKATMPLSSPSPTGHPHPLPLELALDVTSRREGNPKEEENENPTEVNKKGTKRQQKKHDGEDGDTLGDGFPGGCSMTLSHSSSGSLPFPYTGSSSAFPVLFLGNSAGEGEGIGGGSGIASEGSPLPLTLPTAAFASVLRPHSTVAGHSTTTIVPTTATPTGTSTSESVTTTTTNNTSSIPTKRSDTLCCVTEFASSVEGKSSEENNTSSSPSPPLWMTTMATTSSGNGGGSHGKIASTPRSRLACSILIASRLSSGEENPPLSRPVLTFPKGRLHGSSSNPVATVPPPLLPPSSEVPSDTATMIPEPIPHSTTPTTTVAPTLSPPAALSGEGPAVSFVLPTFRGSTSKTGEGVESGTMDSPISVAEVSSLRTKHTTSTDELEVGCEAGAIHSDQRVDFWNTRSAIFSASPQEEAVNWTFSQGHATTFSSCPKQIAGFLRCDISIYDLVLIEWCAAVLTEENLKLLEEARKLEYTVPIFFIFLEEGEHGTSGKEGNDTAEKGSAVDSSSKETTTRGSSAPPPPDSTATPPSPHSCPRPPPPPLPPDVDPRFVLRGSSLLEIFIRYRPLFRAHIRQGRLLKNMRGDDTILYQVTKKLATGYSSDVYKVFFYASKGYCAQKMIPLNAKSIPHVERIYKEVAIMRELNHPNIVAFSNVISTPLHVSIFMELCEYSLEEWLRSFFFESKMGPKALLRGGESEEGWRRGRAMHSCPPPPLPLTGLSPGVTCLPGRPLLRWSPTTSSVTTSTTGTSLLQSTLYRPGRVGCKRNSGGNLPLTSTPTLPLVNAGHPAAPQGEHRGSGGIAEKEAVQDPGSPGEGEKSTPQGPRMTMPSTIPTTSVRTTPNTSPSSSGRGGAGEGTSMHHSPTSGGEGSPHRSPPYVSGHGWWGNGSPFSSPAPATSFLTTHHGYFPYVGTPHGGETHVMSGSSGSGGEAMTSPTMGHPFSQPNPFSIIRHLLDGAHYLHTAQLVHGDIQPKHILFLNGVAKLIDFSSAALEYGTAEPLCQKSVAATAGGGGLGVVPLPVASASSTSCLCATSCFPYAAPEIFLGKPYAASCDIWSIGVIIAELLGLYFVHTALLHPLELHSFYTSLSRRHPLPMVVMNASYATVRKSWRNNTMMDTVRHTLQAAYRCAKKERKQQTQRVPSTSSTVPAHSATQRNTGSGPSSTSANDQSKDPAMHSTTPSVSISSHSSSSAPAAPSLASLSPSHGNHSHETVPSSMPPTENQHHMGVHGVEAAQHHKEPAPETEGNGGGGTAFVARPWEGKEVEAMTGLPYSSTLPQGRSPSPLLPSSISGMFPFVSGVPPSSSTAGTGAPLPSFMEGPRRTMYMLDMDGRHGSSHVTTHSLPASLIELLEKCLCPNPAQRMTIDQLLEHPIAANNEWLWWMYTEVNAMYAKMWAEKKKRALDGKEEQKSVEGVRWKGEEHEDGKDVDGGADNLSLSDNLEQSQDDVL